MPYVVSTSFAFREIENTPPSSFNLFPIVSQLNFELNSMAYHVTLELISLANLLPFSFSCQSGVLRVSVGNKRYRNKVVACSFLFIFVHLLTICKNKSDPRCETHLRTILSGPLQNNNVKLPPGV